MSGEADRTANTDPAELRERTRSPRERCLQVLPTDSPPHGPPPPTPASYAPPDTEEGFELDTASSALCGEVQ